MVFLRKAIYDELFGAYILVYSLYYVAIHIFNFSVIYCIVITKNTHSHNSKVILDNSPVYSQTAS
jgi:hypothetical protein